MLGSASGPGEEYGSELAARPCQLAVSCLSGAEHAMGTITGNKFIAEGRSRIVRTVVKCGSCWKQQSISDKAKTHICDGCRGGMRLHSHSACRRETWVSGLIGIEKTYKYLCGCGKQLRVRVADDGTTLELRQASEISHVVAGWAGTLKENKTVSIAGVVAILFVIGLFIPDNQGQPSTDVLFLADESNTPDNCDVAFTTLAQEDPSITETDRSSMVEACVSDDQSQYDE